MANRPDSELITPEALRRAEEMVREIELRADKEWGECSPTALPTYLEILRRHYLEAIAGALPQWRPIETAPAKICLLVWGGEIEDNPEVGYIGRSLSDSRKAWRTDSGDALNPAPTHWMPLPEPPK